MDEDKFYKVILTHVETLNPEITAAICIGERPRPDRSECRVTYHRTRKGAHLEAEGLLKDSWFGDADIDGGGYVWHCSKLRISEIHTPGHKAYTTTQVIYREIRIEAYTIRD